MYIKSLQHTLMCILSVSGMTISELSHELGISRQTLYRVLSGEFVSEKTRYKLIKFYCHLNSV